jgi:hypothetical protein
VSGTICDDLFIVCGKYSYDSQERKYAITAMNAICVDFTLINPISYYKLCVHLSDSYVDMRDCAYKVLMTITSHCYDCIVSESMEILKNTLYHNFIDSREYATVILGEICKYNSLLITESLYKTLSYFVICENEKIREVTLMTLKLMKIHCDHLSHVVTSESDNNDNYIINNDKLHEITSISNSVNGTQIVDVCTTDMKKNSTKEKVNKLKMTKCDRSITKLNPIDEEYINNSNSEGMLEPVAIHNKPLCIDEGTSLPRSNSSSSENESESDSCNTSSSTTSNNRSAYHVLNFEYEFEDIEIREEENCDVSDEVVDVLSTHQDIISDFSFSDSSSDEDS